LFITKKREKLITLSD